MFDKYYNRSVYYANINANGTAFELKFAIYYAVHARLKDGVLHGVVGSVLLTRHYTIILREIMFSFDIELQSIHCMLMLYCRGHQ